MMDQVFDESWYGGEDTGVPINNDDDEDEDTSETKSSVLEQKRKELKDSVSSIVDELYQLDYEDLVIFIKNWGFVDWWRNSL